MRILFVVERATQFEAPFFRYAAGRPEAELQVLFTRPAPGGSLFDPELGREVSWGIDLLAGYEWAAPPEKGAGRWLAREIARRRPDLVIVNGYTRRDYLAAALAARARGTAVALRTDSVLWPETGRPALSRRLLYRRALPALFRLFFTTGTLGRRYLEACGIAADRIARFPYAVDADHFRSASALAPAERRALRARLGIPEEARVVLAVTKMSGREAPWDLLRAAAALPGDDLRFLLVGDGEERGALEGFATAHLAGRAVFAGYVPYPELPSLYGLSDLFVHPAREERWGVSVAEAMAAGLPVVTSSRVGAATDLVARGRNGFVYPAGRPDELAATLPRALALDPAEVAHTNRGILASWGYAAAWRSLLDGAARAAPSALPG